MDKKRSKGVTFLGWLFIIFSIIQLFVRVMNHKQQIQVLGIGNLLFGASMSFGYLVCGIFLLKLNEFARKAAILLGIISIISIPIFFKPILKSMNYTDYYNKAKQKIITEMKPEYQQKALENLERSIELNKKVLPKVMIFISIMATWFPLLTIYFFTRTPVKEQFKEQQP